MPFTRKFLSALGIEQDKVDEIMSAHVEVTNALMTDRDSYKEKAEKYDKVQKELDEANKKIADFGKEDSYKVKYEGLKEEFSKFKGDVEAEKSKSAKTEALRSLLKEINISDKRIDSVLKVTKLDDIILGEDGKIKDAADLKKNLTKEWEDFIVKDNKQGADVSNPPGGSGTQVKSREEIMKIKDTQERQAAWAELIRNGGN